jgi:glycerol-3-phosphate acyltransferase PlsY
MLGGALSCIAAIASTIYFYFKGTPDVSMCAGTLFGLSGIVLLLISWDWVEATNKLFTGEQYIRLKQLVI